MKIEVGKLYRSRDGHKVRVYSLDGEEDYPVHAAIERKYGAWRIISLTPDGKYMTGGEEDWDIISEWAEPLDFDPNCLPAWAYWIAMNEDGHWFWHQLKPTPTSDESKHIWAASGGGMNGGIHYNFIPKNYTGDWKDSLFSVNELKNDQP